MQTTQIKNGQTLLDIAMQQNGDVTTAAALALQNDINLTNELEIGTAVQNTDVKSQTVVDYFNAENKKPASRDNHETRGGIGFWRIGIDFKIS